MANYTLLLGEYLQDNTLPEIFSQIDNFDNLFIQKYIDHEIGFETEWMFQQKLEMTANVVIPEYKTRLDNIEIIRQALFSKLDVSHSESITATYNNGEQEQKQTVLPFNTADAEPNTIVNNSAVVNSEKRTNNRIEGLRPSDLKIEYDEILKTKDFLLQKLLNEFNSLFMKIY